MKQRTKNLNIKALGIVCSLVAGLGVAQEWEEVGQKYPLQIRTQFEYDAHDNVTKRIASDGAVTHYTYDRVDRLTFIDHPGTEQDVTLRYNELDRLTNLVDSIGSTKYFYAGYPWNELYLRKYPNGHEVYYERDSYGRRISQSVDAFSKESYHYDPEGRIDRIGNSLHGISTLDYNPDTGQLRSKQLGNGVKIEYLYDDQTGQVIEMEQTQPNGERIAHYSYGYLENGLLNIMSETSPAFTNTREYAYDDLLRLTHSYDSSLNRFEEYTYDANGNRLSKTVDIGGTVVEQIDYIYNGLNQLLAANDHIYFYDPKGNVRRWQWADSYIDYIWDHQNRLIRVEKNLKDQTPQTIEYRYNGLGERVMRILTEQSVSTTNHFVNTDGANYQPLAIFEGDHLKQLFYPGGTTYAQDGNKYYLLPGMGGVERVIDNFSRESVRYHYDPFGNVIDKKGTLDSPLTYQGEQVDPDTGLVFLRNRWYCPKIGRFLSIDPHPGYLWKPQTLNPYLYCHNDPVNYVDPLGLDVFMNRGIPFAGLTPICCGMNP